MKFKKKCILPAVAFAAFLPGCSVDKDYSVEKINKLDPEITLFQDGLTIPLIKNTVELYAEAIVNDIEDSATRELLKVKDGQYEIRLAGHEDLSSFIKDFGLSDAMKIDPVREESDVKFDFGDLDPEKFKSDKIDFGDVVTMPDLSDVSDIRIDPINETIGVDTGLKGTDFDINVNVNPFERKQVLFSKNDIVLAGSLSPVDEVELPTAPITLDVNAESIGKFTIPSSIKNINSVTLKEGAKVSVSLTLTNCVFTAGSITPDIEIDLSDLLSFTGGSGVIDLSSMTLNSSNGFSATKSFPIAGVNVSKLAQDKSVSVKGSVAVAGAKSTKAKCAAASGDLGIVVSISFPDFAIESVACEINGFDASVNKNVDFKIDDIALPDEVNSLDYVTFSEESNVTMLISASNLDKIKGATMRANSVKVTFPEGLEVSGANVVDNVLSLSDVDLSTGYNAVVKVSKLNLPAPKNGKISYSPSINVQAECTANGTINTADLKKLGDGDIAVSAKVTSKLEIADFRAAINEYKATIPKTEGTISFEVPDKASAYGLIMITPEGNPAISFKMDIPDLGDLTLSAGDGIKVQLPKFIIPGTLDPDLEFDKENNVLTIKQIKNKTYNIPIEKLGAVPEKIDDVYKVTGKYAIQGDVSIASGYIGKSTLDKVSGAKLGFNATVPSIKASKLSVESLSFDVDEVVDLEILRSEDIPDMLVNVGEVLLKDVKANLSLELEGLPSIGSGAKYIIDLKAELPSFVKPSSLDIRGEIKNGKFTNPPIAIEGFDLSGYDFPKMKSDGESLDGRVKVTGRVYADNPEVDLNTLSGSVEGKLKVDIADSDNKIRISSISAKVDYQVDTTFSFSMADFNDKLGDVFFDLPDVTAIVGMRSNLSLPVSAQARIVPLKDNVENGELAITKDLVFPYSQTAAQSDTVTNTLTFNFNDILNSKCDSVRVHLGLNVEKNKYFKVEPEADYSLGIGYDVSLPLQPRSEFKVELADTLNLEGALSGLEEILSKASVGIMGDIENAFPIGVKIKMTFLSYDKDKDVYTALPLKEVETDLLKPNSEASFEIVTGLENQVGTLPEITHMRFSCTLTSDGQAISPQSYLKIKNIALVLPEGITADLDNM